MDEKRGEERKSSEKERAAEKVKKSSRRRMKMKMRSVEYEYLKRLEEEKTLHTIAQADTAGVTFKEVDINKHEKKNKLLSFVLIGALAMAVVIWIPFTYFKIPGRSYIFLADIGMAAFCIHAFPESEENFWYHLYDQISKRQVQILCCKDGYLHLVHEDKTVERVSLWELKCQEMIGIEEMLIDVTKRTIFVPYGGEGKGGCQRN